MASKNLPEKDVQRTKSKKTSYLSVLVKKKNGYSKTCPGVEQVRRNQQSAKDYSSKTKENTFGRSLKITPGHETKVEVKSKNIAKTPIGNYVQITFGHDPTRSKETEIEGKSSITPCNTLDSSITTGQKKANENEFECNTSTEADTKHEPNHSEGHEARVKSGLTEPNLSGNSRLIDLKVSKDAYVEDTPGNTDPIKTGKRGVVVPVYDLKGPKETEDEDIASVTEHSTTESPEIRVPGYESKQPGVDKKSKENEQGGNRHSGSIASVNFLNRSAESNDHNGAKPKTPVWKLCVNTTECDMANLDVDIVVSSEDESLQGFGMVAKNLAHKGGEKYEEQKLVASNMIGILKPWHFIFTPGAGRLKCKNVAHINIPKIREVDQDAWCQYFSKALCRLLKRVDCLGFNSMAIPLLGTGRNGASRDFVIDLLCTQIQKFSVNPADNPCVRMLYIVHPDRSVVKTIQSVITRLQLHSVPEVKHNHHFRTEKKETREDESFMERYSVKSQMVKSYPADENCPVCLEKIDLKERTELNKCHHVLCLPCAKNSFSVKPVCPICNVVYGIVRGVQPKGHMVEVFEKESLPGFDGRGTIHIFYSFVDGKQDAEHPHPGKRYRGTRREAFLPDNKEGQKVHRLLRKSFEQKLTFTIGISRTTGREDVVTWNDVHHKTRTHGGPERFGYPDPSYLRRVEEELAAKGIYED
ncbi:uncharacterized protein LOC132557215 [Ylistrum balloti]|uniref:uncharacterized protein LOC132557215 n=1 Tax=Ylistrum balloti TaxID=509963 RepID=UPI002905E80C|nr:uncharacterized protein LOC132557215 [Ylistrum balloti]